MCVAAESFRSCGSLERGVADCRVRRSYGTRLCRWAKSAGRWPAGLNVREIKGVELGPEDVALGAEGGVGFVLLFARCGVFDDQARAKSASSGACVRRPVKYSS